MGFAISGLHALPVWAAVLGAALVLSPQPAPAAGADMPTGAVILTIGGDISRTNRGPVEPEREGFFGYHEIAFERAFEFDRAMLDAYAQKQVVAQPPQLEEPGAFRGPLLADVLKDIGAEGGSIRTMSLDGFGVEIGAEKFAARDWILATAVNGRPLAIGGQGPVWFMHTPSQVAVPEAEEQGWPWAVFYIEVTR